MIDSYYTVKDVALRFNVTIETVRRWCRTDKIEYIKGQGTKGRILFSYEMIERFFDTQYDRYIPDA